MSKKDSGPLSFLPDAPKVQAPEVNVKNPTATDATAGLMILSQIVSVAVLMLISMNVLNSSWLWVSLGTVLFAMVVNPIVTLTGVREALAVVLQGFNFMAFMLVQFPEVSRNALLTTVVLLLAFFLFEFPRRFGFE